VSNRDELVRIRAGFHELSERSYSQLRADWSYRIYTNGKRREAWRLAGATGRSGPEFAALARQAVAALDLPCADDPVDAWLATLKQQIPSCFDTSTRIPATLYRDGKKAGEVHSATIHDVAGVSADAIDAFIARAVNHGPPARSPPPGSGSR